MDMNEIKEIFFQECEEQLAELESGLLKLNDGDRDPETVNAVFRAVHSIKGGAGAFGLEDLVAFAHVFETTLDCVRSNRLEPTQDVLKVMLKSADVLADLTNAARDGGYVDETRSRALVKELEALANGEAPAAKAPEPAAAAAAPAPSDDSGFQPIPFSFDSFDDGEAVDNNRTYEISFRPRRELYTKGNEAALLLRDLSRIGEMTINCDADTLPAFDKMDPEEAYFTWTIELGTAKGEDDIRTVFEFAEWDCDLEIKEVSAAAPADERPMIPVPFDLSALDEGDTASVTASPSVNAAAEAVAAAETATSVSKMAAAAARVESKEASAASTAAAQNAAAAAAAGQTIRVDLDRVDRLINRVGERSLYRAAPVATEVPERSVRRVPPMAPDTGATWPGHWPRPPRLLASPEPIETMALLPDHPPVAFTWRGIRRRVRQADGPERIRGEWWRRDSELTAVRDYFRVEDDAGERYWIFRSGDGQDPNTGSQRWFLHGVFG